MATDAPDKPVLPDLTPEEQAREKFLQDFRPLMNDARFRRWLWHLLEADGWFEIHATGADLKDPHRMYFVLGRREVGLQLVQTAMAECPETYMRMLSEARNAKAQREIRADLEERE